MCIGHEVRPEMKKLFRWILSLVHPLLLAVFPILFLYAHNISETSTDQVLMPMLFSAAGALVLWVALSLVLRSTFKAGLTTTLFVILFFSYGRFYDFLEKWGVFVPSHGVLLPGLLLLWGYCVYFIKLAKRDFRNTTKVLNVLAVVLILVNVVSIVSYEIGKPKLSAGELPQAQDGSTPTEDSTETGAKPDIYYFILDEYASPDTMAEYYGYDKNEFVEFLASKGFFVASASRSRTCETFRSIASSLNMEYTSDTEPQSSVFQKIENSKVASFLRTQGYRFIYVGSWFDAHARYKVNADETHNFYLSGGANTVGEFAGVLWSSTMLLPFYDYLTASQSRTYYRGGITDTVDFLSNTAGGKEPKFVCAHIMCPHPPLVFGRDGEPVPVADWYNFQDKDFYLGQYMYIGSEMERVIGKALEDSTRPPVILVQSDHGLRSIHPGSPVGSTECQKILNAYYFPGHEESLHDGISPVNSFRVIFNSYFGTAYEMLEDYTGE